MILMNCATLDAWFETFTRAARTSSGGIVDEVFGAVLFAVVVRAGVFFCPKAASAKIAAKTITNAIAFNLIMIFPAC